MLTFIRDKYACLSSVNILIQTMDPPNIPRIPNTSPSLLVQNGFLLLSYLSIYLSILMLPISFFLTFFFLNKILLFTACYNIFRCMFSSHWTISLRAVNSLRAQALASDQVLSFISYAYKFIVFSKIYFPHLQKEMLIMTSFVGWLVPCWAWWWGVNKFKDFLITPMFVYN